MKEKNVSLLNSKSNVGRNSQGITLIALVVTIVVLLILAGISITLVLGENGIISMAKRAAEQTNDSIQNEMEELNRIVQETQNYLNGSGTSGNPEIGGGTETGSEVADLIGKPADPNNNIDVEDEYGNPITIPAGFTVVPDGEDEVEYNYSGDKKPTVQDGIVVEDSEGNQFVWIPVGEITNKDGSKTTIDLARYTFNTSTGAIANKVTDGSELKLSTTDSYGFLEESASSTTYNNSKAKDIEGFLASAKSKGGYYLARYEASQNGEKPMSKANQEVWNYITQLNASVAAGKMYTSEKFESDLINSYSWDTAIVFIQTYGGEKNSNYSMHTSKNRSLAKTGESGDKVLNIYDIASNCAEWTTETCTSAGGPCINRGGYCSNVVGVISYTSCRYSATTTRNYDIVSFRSTLYMK